METGYAFKYTNLIRNMSVDKNGVWAYPNFMSTAYIPTIGFKIHISAVLSNVLYITKIIVPFLNDKKVPYKIAASLDMLVKINSGECGYSQIGKFITIYPRNKMEFCELLDSLDRLTKGFNSIAVPSDYRYKVSTVVYYRYGEFVENSAINDCRIKCIPQDIRVPTKDYYIKRVGNFPENFRIINCIRTRGKSKVYFGIDLGKRVPCIIKEGILLGELCLDGCDGMTQVMNEYDILKQLEKCEFVPKVYDFFYFENNIWLVEEFIKGKSLLSIMCDNNAQLLTMKDSIFLNLCNKVEKVLSLGIFPYDLSPDNIMVQKESVYLIDTEQYSFNEEKSYPGMNGFWCKNFTGKKSVFFSLLAIAYFLYNPEKMMIFLKQGYNQDSKPLYEIYSKFAISQIKDKKVIEKIKIIIGILSEGEK